MLKELKERILVSILISPLIILIALPNLQIPIYLGFVYLFFIALSLIILFEVIRMFESKYYYIPKLKKTIAILYIIVSTITLSSISIVEKKLFITFSEKILINNDIGSISTIIFSLITLTLILILSTSSINISKQNYLLSDSILLTTSLYISITISSMLVLKLIDIDNNTFFLAFVLGVGWFSEAGALLIGKILGKTKLSFIASPNKTLEGTLGMVAFGILGGVIFKLILSSLGYENPLFIPSYNDTIILSIVIVILCFFGDIIESLYKRFFDFKDSSNILLSLGGIFDVFDGVMLASFGVMIYLLI